ncbi:MAG TPA: hypothetical protein VFS00_24655, partial [Polyangiaceae bacterium]|nr:hypothetical protein [Polyangiaceae bacterium]
MPPRALRPRASLALALALSACAPAPRVATPPPPAPPAREPAPPAPRPAAGVATPPRPAPPEVSLSALPPRPADAPSGSAFVRALEAEGEAGREAAVLREICRGNVPGYLRRLARLEAAGETRSGRPVALTLWVTPDYLAVGDDADSVRVPMNAITAQTVADRLGFVLPTAKIVDLVYRLADARLSPRPFP